MQLVITIPLNGCNIAFQVLTMFAVADLLQIDVCDADGAKVVPSQLGQGHKTLDSLAIDR